MFNKILKMHQSKIWYCTIILQTKRTLQSRWGGEGVEFCEFAGPPHHAKKSFLIPPILKIGNCKTSIYNIQEMHFRDPQYQKWHFWYPWYKKCISRPLYTKNGDPVHFLMFWSPYTKWPLINGQNLPLSSYNKGQNFDKNGKIW